jgi:hypothetical protein
LKVSQQRNLYISLGIKIPQFKTSASGYMHYYKDDYFTSGEKLSETLNFQNEKKDKLIVPAHFKSLKELTERSGKEKTI